jgi:hypothetical protein
VRRRRSLKILEPSRSEPKRVVGPDAGRAAMAWASEHSAAGRAPLDSRVESA